QGLRGARAARPARLAPRHRRGRELRQASHPRESESADQGRHPGEGSRDSHRKPAGDLPRVRQAEPDWPQAARGRDRRAVLQGLQRHPRQLKQPKTTRRRAMAKKKGDEKPKQQAAGDAGEIRDSGPREPYTSRLRKRYQDQVVPKLMSEFGIKNPMAVPRL